VPPPGGNGTTIVSGFAGHACASTPDGVTVNINIEDAKIRPSKRSMKKVIV
jgi:hypothetical protein